MQIKTTMKYHLIPVTIDITKRKGASTIEDTERKEFFPVN